MAGRELDRVDELNREEQLLALILDLDERREIKLSAAKVVGHHVARGLDGPLTRRGVVRKLDPCSSSTNPAPLQICI